MKNFFIGALIALFSVSALAETTTDPDASIIQVVGSECRNPWVETNFTQSQANANEIASQACAPQNANRVSAFSDHGPTGSTSQISSCQPGLMPFTSTASFNCGERSDDITPPEECVDCQSQPNPDKYCRETCACRSAFCGAW